MATSYNKLWKLLIDKKMSKADLRKASGVSLPINANNPIAIVEAKDNNLTVFHGLQQSMT